MLIGDFKVSIPQGSEDSKAYVSLEHGSQYTILLNNYSERRCAAEVSIDSKVIGVFRIASNGSLQLERSSEQDGKFTFYRSGSKEAKLSDEKNISKDDRGLITVVFKPEKQTQELEVEDIDYIRRNYPNKPPYFPIPNPWKPYHPPLIPTDPYWYNEIYSHNQIGSPDAHIQNCLTSHTEQTKSRSCQHTNKVESRTSGITGLSGHSDQKFKKVGNLDYDEDAFVTINLRLVCNDKQEIRPLRKVKKSRGNEPPAPLCC